MLQLPWSLSSPHPSPVPSKPHLSLHVVRSRLGKYSLAKTVYDPLDLASKYDVNWLREAEIKCVPPLPFQG